MSLVPIRIRKFYRKYFKKSRFHGKSPKEAFTEIYNDNYWKGAESISGKGSDASQTKVVIGIMDQLIAELEIKSMLDVPCGDFAWMQHVDLSQVKYIGGDIVDDLIHNNQEKYTRDDQITFAVINLIKDPLPVCDMLFTRDCLVHLSYENIQQSIQNIKSSRCTYLLTTTFVDRTENHDITTGTWRAINLQKAPFNFPPPIKLINEQCTQGHGKFKDKSLALWKIEDVPLPDFN